jgi:hypothetical protein
MIPASQRTDALSAITLVENIARLATLGLFGFIFSAFAEVGKAYLTFFCNAVSLQCHLHDEDLSCPMDADSTPNRQLPSLACSSSCSRTSRRREVRWWKMPLRPMQVKNMARKRESSCQGD